MTRQSGFTLVELFIVMLLLAVIAGFGYPAFTEMHRNNQMANTVNDTLLALQLARSEASRRGRTVTACASADGQNCGGNWGDGWMVFVDSVQTGSTTPVNDDGILRINRKDTVVTTEGDVTAVSFSSIGEAVAGSGTIALRRPECGASQGRDIQITAGGRARSAVVDC